MAHSIEPFYKILGAKIQDAREEQKITQAQLGLRLNPPSTRASIANIENGKQRVLVHTFVQLAKALSVDIQELMPAADQPAQAASPKDVERELRRKLNLGGPELKRLAVASRPSSRNSRNRI